MVKAKYKCLMCGAVIYGPAVEDMEQAEHALNRTVYRGGQFGAPEPFGVHRCSPVEIGMTVLQGYVGGFEPKGDKG